MIFPYFNGGRVRFATHPEAVNRAKSLQMLSGFGRIADIQFAPDGELVLEQHLERPPDLGNTNLGALGTDVTAKPQEVGAEQEGVAAQVLFHQMGSGRRQR